MNIVIENVSKTYKIGTGSECKALKNANISIPQGSLIAIIGKSGSGKSTLLHILGLSDTFDSGTYYLDEKDVSTYSDKQKAKIRNKNIGYILQDFALIPELNVFDNIAIPLYISGVRKKKIQEKIDSILMEIGLQDIKFKKVNELSGGQKQRVAIARSLTINPDIILADEPTGSLDVNTGNEIMSLLLKMNQKGATVIIVTHDMDIAKKCDRIVTIEDGILTENEIN